MDRKLSIATLIAASIAAAIMLVQTFGQITKVDPNAKHAIGEYKMLWPYRLHHALAMTQIRTLVIIDSVGVGFDSTGKPLYLPVVTAVDTIPGDSVGVRP